MTPAWRFRLWASAAAIEAVYAILNPLMFNGYVGDSCLYLGLACSLGIFALNAHRESRGFPGRPPFSHWPSPSDYLGTPLRVLTVLFFVCLGACALLDGLKAAGIGLA